MKLIREQPHKQYVEDVQGDFSVFLRMVLSCIVDADHTNTGRHYRKFPESNYLPRLLPEERLAQLDKAITKLHTSSDNNKRNLLRNEMYWSCRNAEIHTGISSCDSPVGSGKTSAVMAHLLAQAAKRKLRRIIVVLPFTNIITQSVNKYRDVLVLPGEDPKEVVAELHHRADFDSVDTRHLTTLWQAPIIVTTAVAFFETLASNNTAALRRLYELPGSAIFVDESHAALPAKFLPIAWRWMNIMASEWSCYWVLASGSLSRFWTIPDISGGDILFVPEIVESTIRAKLTTYEEKRITFKHDLSPKTLDMLIEWIVTFSGPRIVIMNTVQSAAVLAYNYGQRYGRDHVEHLSTALTPDNRESTLRRIKLRLTHKNDLDWTLIATSCVEAGMDFSFRTGFRELASLSSLLQASGRVNREGSMPDTTIWTFCIGEDKWMKQNPGVKNAANVLRGYLEKDISINPSLTTASIAEEIALYGMNPSHRKLLRAEELRNFPYVDSNFRVIDSDTRIAIVSQDVRTKYIHGKLDWRELQRTSVQITKYKLDDLRVPLLADGLYYWNLGYDDFLGYMSGVLHPQKHNEVLIF